jgi:polysaccharide pyruvyl transferase WcaK-like protein
MSATAKVGLSAPIKVLLVGYNGANNTGSEARLLAIIEDVRSVFGPNAMITIPTLNEGNLRRYVTEDEHLRIEPIPTIFYLALRRLIKQHDLIMLIEGSCYMDTWAAPLLWAYLVTSKYSREYGKPSIAYAIDAGKLASKNVSKVRRDASKVDLIITRTHLAAKRLSGWGVTAPIKVTDDTAFTFDAGPEKGTLARLWPEAKEKVVGIAVVDFHIWPVVLRPLGRKEDCYRWPYYFSRSPSRRSLSEELASRLSKEADHLVEQHGRKVALIAMESVDEHLAQKVHSLMRNKNASKVFSSNYLEAAEMTRLLRDLDLLVTSRYHAAVLSMAAGVPQTAIGHDLRLHDLYQESGLFDDFFIPLETPELWHKLHENIDRMVSEGPQIKERILKEHQAHLLRARRNVSELRNFAIAKGLPVV